MKQIRDGQAMAPGVEPDCIDAHLTLQKVHSQKQLQVTYKTKKTTTGLFKKKNTVVDSGSFRKNSAG